jgi:dihydroorotase/N-acyl-D-amino-acid deacylase
MPAYALEGGREAGAEAAADAGHAQRAAQGNGAIIAEERGGGDPNNVQLSRCDWDHSLDGKRLGDVTKGRGLEPTIDNAAETVFWIVEKGGCGGIFHAIEEETCSAILRHPATMIGSDGEVPIFGQANPHPRSYGTFVRVLGRYVRELKVITLEDAVRKMSSFPAQRIGLADRGVLREGMKADIAVFDAATVRDTRHLRAPASVRGGRRVCDHQRSGRLRRGKNDRRTAGPGALRALKEVV